MSTIVAVQITNENLVPQDANVIITSDAPIKPSEIVSQPTDHPIVDELPKETDENEEAEYSDSEDEDDDDVSIVDSEGEFEEDEDPLDAGYGEQSIEVPGPLSVEEEAEAARLLAAAFGFTSTDDALAAVGSGIDKRMTQTLNTYSNLINQHDTEAVQFYDGISEKINVLRQALSEGISKMILEWPSTTGQPVDASAVEVLRTQLEAFLRTILYRATIMAEYSSPDEVRVADILQALQHLGRPLYWSSTPSSTTTTTTSTTSVTDVSMDAEAMDEDEDDADYSPEDDEDEDMAWQQQPDSGNVEDDESVYYINQQSWKDVVDIVRNSASHSGSLAAEGYEVLQTACENYLASLVEASIKSCQYVGKLTPTAQEVRFALEMMSTVRH